MAKLSFREIITKRSTLKGIISNTGPLYDGAALSKSGFKDQSFNPKWPT